MIDANQTFSSAMKAARPEAGGVPDFDTIMQAAERRAGKRRWPRVAAAAAIAVLAAVVVLNVTQPPVDDTAFIEMNAFMSSTSWSAPSDVLLPKSRINIYEDVPRLMESTEDYGGALL
ncbi:MAG: hypothetical protein WBN09_10555 [Woeseiaceae bacterium]